MRRKLAAVGASYLIGLIFASIFFEYAIFLICGILLLSVSAVLSAVTIKKYGITAVLLCLALGISVFYVTWSGLEKSAEALLNGEYDISAAVTEKSVITADTAVFCLESNTENGKVGLLLYTDNIDADKGDTLHFKAELSKITNTAYYSTADRYRSNGITLSAKLKSNITVTEGSYPLSFIDDYREYIISRIDDNFPDESGALMKGIFLGDKSSFSDELYSDIKLSGVSHLTAVSGMHLTLIMTVIMSVLSVTRLAYSYRVRFALTVILTVCFMAFFGFTSSVLRSGIMIIIANIGALFYRKSDCLNSVGLAVLLITVFDPLACLDAGLILSAVTTVGAGAIGPEISQRLKDRFPRLNAKLCDTLCVSVCAALAGIPLSAVYFGTFSIAGIAVSVIVVPLFTLCLSAMLIFALTGGFIIPLAVIAHFCCDIMRIIFSAFASVPFLHFSCEPVNVLVTIAVVSIIAVAIAVFFKGRHIIPVLISSLLCFTAVITILPLIPDDSVKILLHSDGKNGSVLILSDDISTAILIGNDPKELSSIKNELLAHNKTRTDMIVLCNTDNNEKNDNELLQDARRLSDSVTYIGNDNMICGRSYSLTCENNSVALSAYDTEINISDVKNIRENKANILWGESKRITSSSPCFFINRYNSSKNGISLYYSECQITINNNGMSVICDYR